MICKQCNGTGMIQIPHVPGASGGWLDEQYIYSGIECTVCNGSGSVDDSESPVVGWQEEQIAEEEIGKTLKYFAHPQVASVELSSEVRVGEKIHINGNSTDFTFYISSMRLDDVSVSHGPPGERVEIQVPHRVRCNDRLYRAN